MSTVRGAGRGPRGPRGPGAASSSPLPASGGRPAPRRLPPAARARPPLDASRVPEGGAKARLRVQDAGAGVGAWGAVWGRGGAAAERTALGPTPACARGARLPDARRLRAASPGPGRAGAACTVRGGRRRLLPGTPALPRPWRLRSRRAAARPEATGPSTATWSTRPRNKTAPLRAPAETGASFSSVTGSGWSVRAPGVWEALSTGPLSLDLGDPAFRRGFRWPRVSSNRLPLLMGKAPPLLTLAFSSSLQLGCLCKSPDLGACGPGTAFQNR